MKHLICVGAVYLDTILRHVAPYFAYTQCLRRLRQLTLRALHCSVPVFPEEDSKLRATRLQARRGGNVCNSLEVIEHLLAQRKHANEVALHLVTCLPSRASPATAKLLSSFGPGSAIDVSHCLCREDKTEPASSYVIRSQHNGSRTIVNFSDLEEMTLPEFAAIAASFRGERETWWHFEGRLPDVTLQCIQHLRRSAPQARVSVEVEKPGRAGLRELAAEADVVFYSKAWAETNGYGSPQACLLGETSNVDAFLALCTWGAEGAAAFSRLDGACRRYRGTPITDVVDSIGAGDTFVAGILYHLVQDGLELEPGEALRFAVELAGRKVQVEGFQVCIGSQ